MNATTKFVTTSTDSEKLEIHSAQQIAEFVFGTPGYANGENFMDLLNSPMEGPEKFFVIGRFLGYSDNGNIMSEPMDRTSFAEFAQNNPCM